MAYIITKQPKPFTCGYCGSIFTAMSNIHQLSTNDPCPVCQTNNGNMRCDKSGVEIARENIESFAQVHVDHRRKKRPDFTIQQRYNLLQSDYNTFIKKQEEKKNEEPDNFFFPNEGSHPCYGISITFSFNTTMNEWIEYHINPDYSYTEIEKITYSYGLKEIDITGDPFALMIWDQYFSEEYDEMLRQLKNEENIIE